MADADEDPVEYASPACFMHELDPAYLGLQVQPQDLAVWRKSERERLIKARLAVSAAIRANWTTGLLEALDEAAGDLAGRVVSTYWPFRGEPDLRSWMAAATARGAMGALPVVVEKAAPLVFRAWREGDRMERGVWNIPVPADGEPVVPDVVIAPVVGFDDGGYRLGYGGGYFDRTLAGLHPRPLVIGVGFGLQRIPTIHPQPHDIPMDVIATEDGIVLRRG